MYDPFGYQNNTNGTNNDFHNSTNEPTGADSGNQTEWQGECYHYYKAPGTPTPEEPNPVPPVYHAVPVPPPKKKKKGGKLFARVAVGVLACLVVSAGSIAGFTALVNNGYVNLTASSATPAFTIVKNQNGTKTTNTAVTSGELTKQQVAKKVIPSVVCIQNYQLTQNTGYTVGGFTFRSGDDEKSGSGDNSTDQSSVSPASEGSGIIATSDGYIITNAHVVSGASSLKVILSNGKTYQAKLIGSDSVTDLAVIKITATGLTAAEFGSSGDLQAADTVMAIGNPGGMEFNSSVTVGYISALNRTITNSETGYTMKCIQTDAAINPGNSGGALVNMKGQVVGINSSKIVATGYEGLGFSIPIDDAQTIISQLKEYGYVKDRAVLGVAGQYIDSMTARFNGLSTAGFYVMSVTSQAASSAGLQQGDIVTKIDGTSITSSNTLTALIAAKKPGETVTLSVTRSLTGQTFTASVKLSQATGK